MKKVFIFISAVILASCGCGFDGSLKYDDKGGGIYVVTVDSCEYVRLWNEAIVHKANCKFCKERAK